ncbi:M48 family metallopeptidase [Saccharothrix violaceirubra]
MLVGFFVLAFGMTFGLGAAVVIAFTTGHSGVGVAKAGILALVVAFAVGGALWKALRTKDEAEGAPLTREEQPRLWAAVDELAAVAGTRPPDDVRLVPSVNAAVWEKTSFLGLKPGPRHLMIGLPLLAGLSVGEIRSVLAHELGHYGGGHTRLSALTYRAKNALAATVENLDGNLLRYPLYWYAQLYAIVAASATRRQELEADRASVVAAGRETAQSALRKVLSLDVAWNVYHENYVSLSLAAERTPRVMVGFRAFLGDPTRQEQLAEVQDRLVDEESSSVFDSHPPIRVRIKAMDALPAADVPRDDRPGWTLVDGIEEMEKGLIRDDLGPVADWPELVERAGAAQISHYANILAEAGRASGIAPHGTSDEIIASLARGEALEALRPHVVDPALTGNEMVTALLEVVRELLAALVVDELVRAGRARFAVNWGREWDVVVDGRAVDVPALVAPVVVDPREAGDVAERILALRGGSDLRHSM